MSAVNDLIDVEILLNARTAGMAAFAEMGGGFSGLAMGGAAAAIAITVAIAEAAKASMQLAAQSASDLTLTFGPRR